MNVEEKLSQAKIRLLFKAPYLAVLTFYLETRKNNQMPIPTMRTDGRRIEFDEKFVESLTLDQVCTVLIHETLHAALQHIIRTGSRNDPLIGNIAKDYATNWIIKETDFAWVEGMPYDEKYHGKTFEEIYDELVKQQKSSQGSSADGKDAGQQTSDEASKADRGQTFDEHLEADVSESESQKLAEEWKMRLAASGRLKGDLPAGFERLVGELLHPKLSWRQLLNEYLHSILKTDYSWVPPNRRFLHSDIYLPRLNPEEQVEVAIGLDTSGSIDDEELKEFLSEIRGITQEFRNSILHIFPCDAEVYTHIEVVSTNGDVDWGKIQSQIKGGGGTDFRPVFNAVEKNDLDQRIQVLVYITDGHGDYPENPPNYPVIWIVKGDYPQEDIPFGKVIRL